MLWPMLFLTCCIAILGVHARLTRLEFDGTLLLFLATFGTAVVHTTYLYVYPPPSPRSPLLAEIVPAKSKVLVLGEEA